MAKNVEMSLLFALDSPPSLLYSFRERGGGRIPLDGRSLASGTFLFNKFLCSDDLVFFSLYELATGETSANRPRRLGITTSNFEHASLFAAGDPDFGPDDFVDKPIVPPPETSPFPGITNLFLWSTPGAGGRPFQVVGLTQDQTFALSAKVIVAPVQPALLARTYRFDPEMVVGPDEVPPPLDPDQLRRGV